MAKCKLRAELRVWPLVLVLGEKARNPAENPTQGLEWAAEDEGNRF